MAALHTYVSHLTRSYSFHPRSFHPCHFTAISVAQEMAILTSKTVWRGVQKGFAEKPVGFTEKDPALKQGTPASSDGSPPRKKIFRGSKPQIVRDYDDIMGSAHGQPVDADQDPHSALIPASRENSPSDDDGDDSDDQAKVDRSSSSLSTAWSFPSRTQHTQPSTSITPFTPMRMSPEKPRRHSNSKNVKANNMLLDMMQRGATIPECQAAWKARTGLETTEAAWRSRFWRLNAKGKTGVRETESPEGDISMADDDGEYDSIKGLRFRAVNSQHTPGTSPYYRRPSRATPASLHDSARQASDFSRRDSIESPALANAGAGAQSSSTLYNNLMTPTESSSMLFTLAPNKLSRTTLRIANSNTFTPLKLRSCSNISALFTKVLDICGLTAHKDTVEALKLTFDWFPEDAEEKTMLIKERYEDSFEFFLETVDEAPCWAGGGKCTVNVEVVKAAKEDIEMEGEDSAMLIEEPADTVAEESAADMTEEPAATLSEEPATVMTEDAETAMDEETANPTTEAPAIPTTEQPVESKKRSFSACN